MKSLLEKLNQMQAVCDGAKHECVTCGSPVGVYSADEGTGSYVPLTGHAATIEAVKVAVERLQKMKENYVGRDVYEYAVECNELANDALAQITKLLGCANE